MITVTIEFNNRQVVLGFNSQDSASKAMGALAGGGGAQVSVEDDYGQTFQGVYLNGYYATMRDVEAHATMQNILGIAEIEREQKFQVMLGKRPDLKFLVGRPNPMFDRK